MKRIFAAGLLSIALGGRAFAVSPSVSQLADHIDIPFTKFVLKNGLTLIVHEDHKAPIVAVNVWYHVGSKNERPGKTGFAHLFEHLMFNGSEHFNDDYFQAMERIGATDLNGTTSEDRTGDLAKIEPGIRQLDWGEIHVISVDGRHPSPLTRVGSPGNKADKM